MQKRMLFQRFFIFCFLFLPLNTYTLTDHLSQSFMFTRPASHNLAMMQSTWHDYIYNKHGEMLGSFQAIPFYQDSTSHGNCNKETARYFLPSCDTSVKVRGDAAALSVTGTYVRAEWVNLPNDFYGEFSIDPQQKKYGVVFEYNQDLKKLFDIDFFKHWWFSITVPYEVVKNDIDLCATASTGRSNAILPATIPQAFNQDSWHYGRISNCKLKKSGLGDVRLKLGATLYAKNNFEVIYYTLIALPTGKKQNPKYIFSPFLGNNKHFTFGNGVNFQLPVTRKSSSWPILFFMNAEHQYLIRNKQYRTFDLKNKPWSRYLLFNKRGSLLNVASTPGVNVLTRRVKVHPDSFVDMSTGFRMKQENFDFELAYNLWAHRTEHIEFLKKDCSDCADDLEDYGIAGSTSQTTASGSFINFLAADDPSFVTISKSDIDKNSGAARSATTHKIHGAFGCAHKSIKYDVFLNLGAFYELSQNNAALHQWGVWGKVGASF